MQGWCAILVSDGSTKRKLRDVVLHKKEGELPFDIFVHPERALTTSVENAMEDADSVGTETINKECIDRFWDVRLFGAAMSTIKIEGIQGAQILGPVQIGTVRSVDPVEIMEQSITRVTPTKKEEDRSMGRKHVVPYGLYRQTVNYNPNAKTADKVTKEDLKLFWNGFKQAWELTRSSARPEMAFGGGYVFTHSSALGNAPSHTSQERVTAETDVENPRSFDDYEITIDEENLSNEIELTRL